MAASKQDIRKWLDEGKEQGATHVIVVCDTYDWDDYPVFVMPGEDVCRKSAEHDGPNMQRVMEVYALHLPIEDQMNEHRAFHYECPPSACKGKAP